MFPNLKDTLTITTHSKYKQLINICNVNSAENGERLTKTPLKNIRKYRLPANSQELTAKR